MQTLVRQTEVYKILDSAKKSGSLSHAYLLTLDDEKILRPLLKALAPLYFPDDERIKERIENESFSDCLIFPKENAKFLVEDAEKIVEESAILPVEGNIKLFVVTDFSKATAQAQNKLLKIIEEPPKGVYFLLGASNSFNVLPTVLSRSKTLEISAFTADQVTEYFKRNVRFTEKQRPFVYPCACLCMGKIGLTEKLISSGEYQPLIEDCQRLLLADKDKLPFIIKKVGEPSYKGYLFSTLALIFKDALLLKKGVNLITLKTEEFWIKKVADKFSSRALIEAQKQIVKAEKDLFFHSSFSMTLEICLVNIFNENKS